MSGAQFCQISRGGFQDARNVYLTSYFIQSVDRNYPILNTLIGRDGLLWLGCVCPSMSVLK